MFKSRIQNLLKSFEFWFVILSRMQQLLKKDIGIPKNNFFVLLLSGIFAFCILDFSGCAPKQITKTTLTVWHWMTDRQGAFEELAKKYQEVTGVNVRFETFFPPESYSQKIQAAAAAKDLPDLFGILAEKKIFASFIKAGYIEDLTSNMQENNSQWKERFIDISLKFNTFEEKNIYGVKPGIYGVPIDTMSIQFLYNKDLLEKAGFNPDNPPTNWDGFINVAKTANKDLGVYGFVCGWGEPWLIYCLVTNYAFNIMGENKFFATIRGQVAYTDPDWIKIFSIFKEMRDSGILAAGIITMNNKEAEQAFSNNKAVFSFNGSWGVNTYKQMNPNLKYDTIPPPSLDSKYTPKIWAGAGSSFVVNAPSLNKSEAIKFLEWLTQKEQQLFLIERTRNLPSIKGCEDKIEVSLGKFLKNIEDTTHPNLWPLNEEPRVIEAINTGIQKIIIGEKTPQEVASEVDKVKRLKL